MVGLIEDLPSTLLRFPSEDEHNNGNNGKERDEACAKVLKLNVYHFDKYYYSKDLSQFNLIIIYNFKV